MHTIPEPTKKDLRSFGIITGIITALLFGLLLPWLFNSASYPTWPWIVLGVLGLFALAAPMLLKHVYYLWMRLGSVLGWINTRIILGLIFFIMFTPVSLILWLLRKDPMRRKLDSGATTYREPSQPAKPKSMENPF